MGREPRAGVERARRQQALSPEVGLGGETMVEAKLGIQYCDEASLHGVSGDDMHDLEHDIYTEHVSVDRQTERLGC